MSVQTYNAYRIEADPSRDRYLAVLVNTVTHAEFRLSVCACARQCIYSATRMNTIPRDFLGAFQMKAGEMIPLALTKECNVRGWTEQHHNFTHVMKLPRVQAPVTQTPARIDVAS